MDAPPMLTISGKARKALDAICDTFVPGEDGLPSATELGVPEAMLDGRRRQPERRGRRRQFAGLFDALGRRTSPLALAGGARADAARLVRLAPTSVQRAAFQALRKCILLSYYCLPWQGEGPNPVDEALGYPGPLGPPENPPPKTIEPLAITADTELDCDVVVVGSGAGGGTAAGVLAAAGLDVVVVEAGGYYSEEDFDGAELTGYARLYLNGGGVATDDQSIGLLAGSCLGGGTVVNYTWCFRPPDFVREDWKQRFGLTDWAGQDFDDSLDAVWERISISSESSIPSARDHAMRARARQARLALRGHAAQLQGLRRGGLPALPLRLPDRRQAVDDEDLASGRLRQRRADRRERAGRQGADRERRGEGRRGVDARRAQADRARPRRALAAGAIHTPAIMLRSGLGSPVGQNLMLHPVLITWGDVRGGGAALGGHARRDLLGRVPRHGRGLRHQVRARRDAAEHPRDLRPLARAARVGRADAVACATRPATGRCSGRATAARS